MKTSLSKKKVILIGLPDPIKLKSKKYIIETLFNRAKKNPFLRDYSYAEYLEFLEKQINTLGSREIEDSDEDIESRIFDSLKKMNWIKVINTFLIGIITTNIGV